MGTAISTPLAHKQTSVACLYPHWRPEERGATSAASTQSRRGARHQVRSKLDSQGFGLVSAIVGLTISGIAISIAGKLMLTNARMMRKTELRQDLNTQIALLQSHFADTGDVVDVKEVAGCTSKEMDRDTNNRWLDLEVICGNGSLSSSKRVIVVEPVDLTVTDATTTTTD